MVLNPADLVGRQVVASLVGHPGQGGLSLLVPRISGKELQTLQQLRLGSTLAASQDRADSIAYGTESLSVSSAGNWPYPP
jgi:hypothetical protein